MRHGWLLAFWLGCCGALHAQTVVTGDMWVPGKVGVGSSDPTARFQVQPSSAAETVFQVSGVDETPFLHVGKSGGVGLSTYAAANLDIGGAGGVLGLELKSGNLYPDTSSYQMTFGYAGQALERHAIYSRHVDSAVLHLNLDRWFVDSSTPILIEPCWGFHPQSAVRPDFVVVPQPA